MEDYSEKKAFILGGTGTIGFETAKMFCKKGFQVTIHGGHDKVKLKKCLAQLKKMSDKRVQGIFEEFSGEAENFISVLEKSKVYECAKNADVLCLCFGPFLQKKIIDMENFEWEMISRLNYIMPAILINAALPNMIKNQFGRIVVFGGTATETVRGFYTNAAYAASKTALCSLIKSVSLQHSTDGITCNAILPGQVEIGEMTMQKKTEYLSKKGFVRFVKPQEIVQTIEFIADNQSITGMCINVDAGWRP
jgi:NAD(P)-dependent dehydrogenase (short-subunit alcohol dehydrogenase family)